ncbi:MAG: hypothetical protein L0213_05085 [Candidatus Dadabacteria bacterium]|nr:hypothetical protein [Candidatus Dadabacteria bacterium]
MFKKTLFLTLSLLLIFSLSAFAGEGSDTVGGGKLLPQLRYGYSAVEWDTDSDAAWNYRDWDVNSHNYYAQLNWGVFENVDLIALVGGRSVCLESEWDTFSVEADCVPMFMWGLGVKGTFFRADNGFYVGGGALFTHSFTGKFTVREDEGGLGDDEWRSDLVIYQLVPELHVGWHLKKIGLTPYVGVDYTWMRAVSESTTAGEIVYRMDEPVYMFTGFDYVLMDKLYINVEGRTNFDEGWGIETGIGYMFDICEKPEPPAPAPAPVIEPKLEPMSKN